MRKSARLMFIGTALIASLFWGGMVPNAEAATYYTDSFESASLVWNGENLLTISNGGWVATTNTPAGGNGSQAMYCGEDPDAVSPQYLPQTHAALTMVNPVAIPATIPANARTFFRFDAHITLAGESDHVRLEYSTDGTDWKTLRAFFTSTNGWKGFDITQDLVYLRARGVTSAYFRWVLFADQDSQTARGIYIDRFRFGHTLPPVAPAFTQANFPGLWPFQDPVPNGWTIDSPNNGVFSSFDTRLLTNRAVMSNVQLDGTGALDLTPFAMNDTFTSPVINVNGSGSRNLEVAFSYSAFFSAPDTNNRLIIEVRKSATVGGAFGAWTEVGSISANAYQETATFNQTANSIFSVTGSPSIQFRYRLVAEAGKGVVVHITEATLRQSNWTPTTTFVEEFNATPVTTWAASTLPMNTDDIAYHIGTQTGTEPLDDGFPIVSDGANALFMGAPDVDGAFLDTRNFPNLTGQGIYFPGTMTAMDGILEGFTPVLHKPTSYVIVSDALDLSAEGIENGDIVLISFDNRRRVYGVIPPNFYLDASQDGGATWSNLWSATSDTNDGTATEFSWEEDSAILSVTNASDVRLRFRYQTVGYSPTVEFGKTIDGLNDLFGGAFYWYIDNLAIGDAPSLPTLAHVPTGGSFRPSQTANDMNFTYAPRFRADVTSDLPLSSVRMYYRTVGSPSFSSAAMSLLSGNTYEVQIPRQVAGTRYQYYFRATNSVGLSTTLPAGTGSGEPPFFYTYSFFPTTASYLIASDQQNTDPLFHFELASQLGAPTDYLAVGSASESPLAGQVLTSTFSGYGAILYDSESWNENELVALNTYLSRKGRELALFSDTALVAANLQPRIAATVGSAVATDTITGQADSTFSDGYSLTLASTSFATLTLPNFPNYSAPILRNGNGNILGMVNDVDRNAAVLFTTVPSGTFGFEELGDWFAHLQLFNDGGRPVITHTPITDGFFPTSIAVNATVTDANLDSVTLFYQFGGDANFTQVMMTSAGGNSYTASIPAPPLGLEVSYYIQARDDFGRNSYFPASGSNEPGNAHTFQVYPTSNYLFLYHSTSTDRAQWLESLNFIGISPDSFPHNTGQTPSLENLRRYQYIFWDDSEALSSTEMTLLKNFLETGTERKYLIMFNPALANSAANAFLSTNLGLVAGTSRTNLNRIIPAYTNEFISTSAGGGQEVLMLGTIAGPLTTFNRSTNPDANGVYAYATAGGSQLGLAATKVAGGTYATVAHNIPPFQLDGQDGFIVHIGKIMAWFESLRVTQFELTHANPVKSEFFNYGARDVLVNVTSEEIITPILSYRFRGKFFTDDFTAVRMGGTFPDFNYTIPEGDPGDVVEYFIFAQNSSLISKSLPPGGDGITLPPRFYTYSLLPGNEMLVLYDGVTTNPKLYLDARQFLDINMDFFEFKSVNGSPDTTLNWTQVRENYQYVIWETGTQPDDSDLTEARNFLAGNKAGLAAFGPNFSFNTSNSLFSTYFGISRQGSAETTLLTATDQFDGEEPPQADGSGIQTVPRISTDNIIVDRTIAPSVASVNLLTGARTIFTNTSAATVASKFNTGGNPGSIRQVGAYFGFPLAGVGDSVQRAVLLENLHRWFVLQLNPPPPTPTPTPTDTPTPSPTPTSTGTPAPSDTPTSTPTNTSTDTPTRTNTPTPTFTNTPTPTNTGTATPTATPTNTPTSTPTPCSVLDPLEPNNSFLQTSPLFTDEAATGMFCDAADEDYFIFRPIAANSIYRVYTSDLAGGVDTTLTIFNSQRTPVAYNDNANGSTTASEITFNFTADREYYVRVNSVNGSMVGPGSDYSLTAQYLGPGPSGEEFDGNYTFNAGWNAFSWRIERIGGATRASDLFAKFRANGLDPRYLVALDRGRWKPYVDGMTVNNMEIVAGKGYLLFLNRAGQVNLLNAFGDAQAITEPVAPDLSPGWNLVGIPVANDLLNANDMCTDLTNQGFGPEVAGTWGRRNWVAYTCNSASPTNAVFNFLYDPAGIYLLYVSGDGFWAID